MFFLLKFWRTEVRKSQCWQGYAPLGGSKGESFLAFSHFYKCLHSLAHSPFLHLQYWILSLTCFHHHSFCDSDPPGSFYNDPCDSIGPTLSSLHHKILNWRTFAEPLRLHKATCSGILGIMVLTPLIPLCCLPQGWSRTFWRLLEGAHDTWSINWLGYLFLVPIHKGEDPTLSLDSMPWFCVLSYLTWWTVNTCSPPGF